MKAELFLALRYLKPKRSAVSWITVLSVVGVTLGVMVMVIVLAVMTGFIDLFKAKLIETQAHIQIYRPYSFIDDPRPILAALEEVGGSGTGIISLSGLVQDERRRFVPKMVIGIDPAALAQHYDLAAIRREGSFELKPGEVLVSTEVQREFRLKIGSKLLIHAPNKLAELVEVSENGGVKLSDHGQVFLPHEFTVAGIFSFGKSDFDSQVLFIGSDDAADLYGLPWGAATMVYGWVPDPYNMDSELKQLRQELSGFSRYGDPLVVKSWEEQNMTFLGVLEVEKRMMFFLLIFIVLVAAFSITNTLITTVYQKTREIGVLKALGSSSWQVLRIFVWQGFFVGVFGAGFGVGLGCLLIHYRNDVLEALRARGTDLFPPQFYYFNELPAHLVASDLLLVAGCAVLLCTLGALIPAWCAARLDPAKALRYE